MRLTRCLLLFPTVAILALPAYAQVPSNRPPFEIAATVAGARPAVTVVTCCELRTPERYTVLDDARSIWSIGASVRYNWGVRAFTTAGAALTPRTRHVRDLPLPAVPPASAIPGGLADAVIGQATAREGWTLALGQGLDVVRGRQWRLSVSAALLVDHVKELYEQTSLVYADPPRESEFSSVRRETRVAGAGVGSLTLHVTSRVFITTDVSVRRYVTTASITRPTVSATLGVGVALGR